MAEAAEAAAGKADNKEDFHTHDTHNKTYDTTNDDTSKADDDNDTKEK